MSKMIVATHSTIRNILIIFLIIIITLFALLKGGISINHLKIGSFYIEKLYLKLDKKLIIKAHKLIIPKKKDKSTLPNLEKILNEVKNILRYFQSIELNEVEFKNNTYSLLYADKVLYMTNNEFEMAAQDVDYIGDELHARIELIYLKKYDIRLSADLVYDVKHDRVMIRGRGDYLDIHSSFVIYKKQDRLYYALNSEEFTQLKPLVEQFNLPPKISAWITDHVQAKKYKINYIKGIAKIDKKGVVPLLDTIRAEAITKDVTVYFRPKLDPVRSKSMRISFEDDILEFHIKKPYFLDRSLDGSKVLIEGLIKKQAILKLDLNLTTPFDKEVDKILQSYKINIPIVQKSGIAKARLQIAVKLKAKKVTFIGDIELTKSTVEIGNVPLSIKKGSIHIEANRVKLSNFILYDSWYKTALKGVIDLKRKSANLILDIDTLTLGNKKVDYFVIKKSRQPLIIDYSKNIKFTLPKLNSGIKMFTKESIVVMNIANINNIKPYLTNIPITIDSGNIEVKTKNFLDYTFKGTINNKDCFIYENNISCLTKIPIEGSVSKNGLILNAFNKRLVYQSSLSTITLTNLHLDLQKFLKNKEEKIESESIKNIIPKILFRGKNSIIRYKTHELLTDKYDIKIDSKGVFSFVGILDDDRVTITQEKDYMSVKANKVTDKMLHPLINFQGLQKGKYSINFLKNKDGISKGEINIYGGVMRGFKTYNNVMAFINTIPSLATLNRPGFSSKGFDIKKGTIKFTLNKDILTLDSIFIEGTSSSISGSGVVNLSSESIKVDLLVMTAREVGKIIGDLPIVGYILMGDSKSVTIGLKITGTLKKPKVKNSAIKDTLLVPLEILKRTINTPKHIYSKQKEKSKIKDKELDMF